MGSCKKKTIYLSGGIDGLKGGSVEDSFHWLQGRLEALDLEVLSPIRGKALASVIDTGEETRDSYTPNQIVSRDLWDLDRSDLVLACPSPKSIGTYMEIFYASKVLGIPVIVVAPDKRVASHFWITGLASQVFIEVEEAFNALRNYWLA